MNNGTKQTSAVARRRRRRKQRNKNRKLKREVKQLNAVANDLELYKHDHKNEEQKYNTPSEIRLSNVLNGPMSKFCEAVVNPFGNGAVGAMLPDRYQDLVIPMLDRLELDISPDFFNSPDSTASWETDPDVELIGITAFLLPRCLASGTTAFIEVAGVASFDLFPVVGWSVGFGAAAPAAEMEAYSVCITGQFSRNGAVYFGYYFTNGTVTGICPMIRAIPGSRFGLIKTNIDKMRILGAGLKMWSEEAPINTGGYCVGGWITVDDIATYTRIDDGLSPFESGLPGAASPGALFANLGSIKYPCRSPGIKGSTVRYSCLQVPDQVEAEYAAIPPRHYSTTNQNASQFWNASCPYITKAVGNLNNSIHDLITPGTYVPIINWYFNGTGPEDRYTIKLMAVMHSEGTPDGACPFMTTKPRYDPASEQVKLMVESPEKFPVAVTGHSFTSFFKKAQHIVAKVGNYASRVQKFMALVETMML